MHSTSYRILSLALAAILLTACQDTPPTGWRPLPEQGEAGMNSPSSETWEVIPLTSSSSYGYARSWAINDSNVVVGTANIGSNGPANVAWKWRDSTFGLLGLPAGASARSINRSGAIVGAVGSHDGEDGCADARPFHLSPAGVLRWLRIDTLYSEYRSAVAMDINDGGRIVGTDCFTFVSQPIQWSPAGNGWRLQRLTYGGFSGLGMAMGVNNNGYVVGNSGNTDTGAHIWRFPDYHAGLDPAPFYVSGARDINHAGYIVGWKSLPGGIEAYLWWPPFSEDPLGFSFAFSISNKMRVAGRDQALPVTARNGVVTLLPLPTGATQGLATAVNTCGIVAGHVVYPGSPGQKTREQPVIWRRRVGGVATCD